MDGSVYNKRWKGEKDMILAIDIGNIRTTIALYNGEGMPSFQSEL